MNGSARVAAAAALVIGLTAAAGAQVTVRPEPEPGVTAELTAWYVTGEPVSFAGNLYYPSGAQVFFNANEMVLSGSFRGVPVYTRTTIEPYSKVFIPVGRGLMQPYERPRTGELAGTAGSTLPPYPVAVASETVEHPFEAHAIQAPAPPTTVSVPLAERVTPVDESDRTEPRAVGTAGRAPLRPLRTAERPTGLDAVYVDFERTRYYSSGPSVLIGRARYEHIGEYHGLPVYIRDGDRGRIFVPVQRGAELLAGFTVRRPR